MFHTQSFSPLSSLSSFFSSQNKSRSLRTALLVSLTLWLSSCSWLGLQSDCAIDYDQNKKLAIPPALEANTNTKANKTTTK